MIDATHRAALDAEGYTILRDAVTAESIGALRETFERLDTPSEGWPAPREHGTRHAMLDKDEGVLRFCALPALVDAASHVLDGPVRLKAVEGRDPEPAHGEQRLHRDWVFSDNRRMNLVKALAFLDDFGPENGATRIVPGSHHEPGDPNVNDPRAVYIEGHAGDIFVFHGRLVHAGSRNLSGAKRRAVQIWFEADV